MKIDHERQFGVDLARLELVDKPTSLPVNVGPGDLKTILRKGDDIALALLEKIDDINVDNLAGWKLHMTGYCTICES